LDDEASTPLFTTMDDYTTATTKLRDYKQLENDESESVVSKISLKYTTSVVVYRDMQILTEYEQKLLLRALDRASVAVEAEKAAEALINSLRERGINGFDMLDQLQPKRVAAAQSPTTAPPTNPPPRPELWGKSPGRWINAPDGITYWGDENGILFPPNSTAEEIKRMGKMWSEIFLHWNATRSPSSGSIEDKINAWNTWKRAQAAQPPPPQRNYYRERAQAEHGRGAQTPPPQPETWGQAPFQPRPRVTSSRKGETRVSPLRLFFQFIVLFCVLEVVCGAGWGVFVFCVIVTIYAVVRPKQHAQVIN
jgi:hypothetical protein